MQIDPEVFRNYDIRGTWPDQITPELFEALGRAYAGVVQPAGPVGVSYDVRLHSKELAEAAMRGLTQSGVSVIDTGLGSTEMLYFAVGNYGLAGGIQATASHNPANWQGAKLVREQVIPLIASSGLGAMQAAIEADQLPAPAATPGTITDKNIIDDYVYYLERFLHRDTLKPMTIVYDANFGFQGKLFERLIELLKLPITGIPLNAEPDGHFPKGQPNPLLPERQTEFAELVKSSGADLGVAWDADADRVFFCDKGGNFINSAYVSTLLMGDVAAQNPGAKIIYGPVYEWMMIDAISEHGGKPILEKVGHGYIKDRMRKEDALFSAEFSAHHFYRDFWYADSGMIPVLQVLDLLGRTGQSLTALTAPIATKYVISGEINSSVTSVPAILTAIKTRYADAQQKEFDGLTIEYDRWRANIRPSSNEPLLRLNVEARDEATMVKARDELLAIIKSQA